MNNNGSYNLVFPKTRTIIVKNGGSLMNAVKSIKQNLSRAALVSAVFLLTLTPAFALTNAGHNVSANNLTANVFKPSAVFNSCWIDYDVTQDGQKGMRIHVNFEVTGLKGIDAKIVSRVQKDDGTYLKSGSSFSNGDGELETSFSMNPGYPTTVYKDGDMFLPYSEISLRKGVWNLKLDIDLNYDDGTLIQHLTFKEFEFTSGGGNTNDTPTKTAISAKVKKVWVDYDVFENKQKGMRIHVNFEVTGLKGVDSKITARVRRDDDTFLASSGTYSNSENQLETSFSMNPGFATTEYEDADMFLPYSEMNLRKGVWQLKLDIDLNYEDGSLIDHLDYHEFEFTK